MFLVFVTLLVFVFGISFVVAWSRAEDVSDIWLQAKHCVQATKMAWYNELLKPVLSQHDAGNLIAPGPVVGPRSHSTINFILAALFPSMRHQPGP
jgi:hypothetical protein